ncbi:SO2930 family diheme c-type cytochrome [Maricaulis sp.]|uniref:SO2930 family diheme c-type cytochrome n=1 Tax=Maricaulis sp. TaxID=1486257 RepID=UPI0026397B63|nr:SO2930 family diheme c-type cytochrome [Maricaulis sp.]
MHRLAFLAGLALLLTACGQETATPRFIDSGNPALLSEWGQLEIRNGQLRPASGVVAYELTSPLFTDYAHKLRTIWMPEGSQATYREGEVLDFPVGTVITKTFYYPRSSEAGVLASAYTGEAPAKVSALDLDTVELIETRILVRRENGWDAIPYRWESNQREAGLNRIGDIIPIQLDHAGQRLDFNYIMPNVNQCASCHAPDSNTREIAPIGPKPRHLNRAFDHGDGPVNQLAHLVAAGMLINTPPADDTPRNADWTDMSASLNARARSYLDINCSHCHSPVGPADTSGLFLEPDTPVGPQLGLCKPPIAAGGGTGDRPYDIVPGAPELSILLYRMDSVEADVMMPEIGRSTIHAEAVALIRDWITQMDGSCA